MESIIYFVTLPNGYFGSAPQSWMSLNVEKISKAICSYGFKIVETSIDKIIDCELKERDIVIYTSSDEENIRNYIKDVMFFINKKCQIIPPYEILLAHENKGYQELYRKTYNFGNLEGGYLFDLDQIPKSFPLVYKKISGAGSSGVALIKNQNDLTTIYSKDFEPDFKRKIIKILRKRKLSPLEYSIYDYRHKGFSNYIYQKFIPDLSCDYRVLIFGEKYFVMRRDVRENDFRASGSKKFSYTDAPKAVLDFAKNVYEKLQAPYASLDVALSKEGCHLIEYQGVNFGSSALRNSLGYHLHQNNEWGFVEAKSNLEENFSEALLQQVLKVIKK